MGLRGNLKTMSVPEIMRFVQSSNFTGTVEVVRGSIWKRIYFEKGKIISAGSSDPSEYLGHYLISQGRITEEQLATAMEVQEKTKVMLGKILVMIGAVSEEEIVAFLEGKCKETIFSLFFWDEADFEFVENEAPSVRAVGVSLEIGPVLEEGFKRMEEFKLLRQTYPSRKIRFAKSGTTISDPILDDPFARKLYDMIDGEKTISEIALHTHASEYKLLESLDQLKTRNLIIISGFENETAAFPPPQVDRHQMMNMAQSKANQKKWDEAINLCKYVLRDDEHDQDAKQLLANAETQLIKSIYDIVPPESIVSLTLPLEELAREKLTSEESFLVTRINGRWDVKSILTITPMKEIQALRIIKRLLDRNIIALQDGWLPRDIVKNP